MITTLSSVNIHHHIITIFFSCDEIFSSGLDNWTSHALLSNPFIFLFIGHVSCTTTQVSPFVLVTRKLQVWDHLEKHVKDFMNCILASILCLYLFIFSPATTLIYVILFSVVLENHKKLQFFSRLNQGIKKSVNQWDI